MVWLIGSIGALMPMLPIYFTSRGVSASHFAVLFSVQAATALVASQAIGYLADVVFRRTTMLLAMSLAMCATAALFPLLPPTLPWLSLGMMGIALFFHPKIAIYNSVVLGSPRGEELFGPIRMAGSLSFALIALLVGWLTDLPAYTVAVIFPAVFATEVLFIASLLRLSDRPPAQRHAPGAPRIGFRAAQRALLDNPLIFRFLVFTFFVQVIAVPMQLLQVRLATNLGASALYSSAGLAAAAIAEMFIFFFGQRLLRRFSLLTLIAVAPIAVFLRLGIIYLIPNPTVILLSNILHMFTFGLAYMTGVVFLNREAPEELRSSGQTLFGLVFSYLSMLIGNLAAAGFLEALSGTLGETRALEVFFGLGSLTSLASLLVLIPLRRAWIRKYGKG